MYLYSCIALISFLIFFQNSMTLLGFGKGHLPAAATHDTSHKTLARQLPVISEEFTSSTSMKLKGKERDEAASLWDIEDDAYLTELTEKYIDQIFYDEEVDATYKVLDVQYEGRRATSKRRR